jgi:hypothetical protein
VLAAAELVALTSHGHEPAHRVALGRRLLDQNPSK